MTKPDDAKMKQYRQRIEDFLKCSAQYLGLKKNTLKKSKDWYRLNTVNDTDSRLS